VQWLKPEKNGLSKHSNSPLQLVGGFLIRSHFASRTETNHSRYKQTEK
jgi:hypothetical protein